MQAPSRSLKLYITASGIGAVACLTLITLYFPPLITTQWLIAFATLLALAVLGALLAITITEGGSTTAMDFLAQLGAIILLGPFGAVVLTTVDHLITEFLVLRKPRHKALFNLSQMVISVTAAALLYVGFGGQVSLSSLDFRGSFPPFIIGVLGYFTLNTVSVSYAIAITQRRPLLDVWRQAIGTVIVFDVVMSSLAYIVAFLYIQWGPVALLSAVVPIIGLRYTYGVNLELQQLNQDLLRVLIKTLEARDKYTSGHSIRVSERSKRIADTLGLRRGHVRLIETAALLHDIGKIDLAYGEILRQAGPLTPEQRNLIRAHPDKGVEIVSSVRSLDPLILQCIRHHHEWFDGSGYPLGLAGEEIPLGARIIMMSDSIDAMLTDRPYRAALSVEKVRQELLRNSGSQFDPLVVEATFAAGVLDEELVSEPRLQAVP